MEVKDFYTSKVIPAFEELKTELEKKGREVNLDANKESTSIEVKFEGEEEFHYAIKVRIYPDHAVPYPEIHYTDRNSGRRYSSKGSMRSGTQNYDISDISKEEIIQHFLEKYKSHLKYKD